VAIDREVQRAFRFRAEVRRDRLLLLRGCGRRQRQGEAGWAARRAAKVIRKNGALDPLTLGSLNIKGNVSGRGVVSVTYWMPLTTSTGPFLQISAGRVARKASVRRESAARLVSLCDSKGTISTSSLPFG